LLAFAAGFAVTFYNLRMSVLALGLNHTTAPLDLRGRFIFVPEHLRSTLQGLQQRLQARAELAIVSTCNRTELYVSTPDERPPNVVATALDWLAQRGQISGQELRQHSYALEGGDAARHAFRVASGLDSMVLGEPQILGQMKQAVRAADSAGTLGSTLHQMFQRSFAVAKEVRSSTDIGAHSISMAAASVRLAAQLFGDLQNLKILFIGAGEMIELVCTHFAAKNPRSITVANRSLERGEKLAHRFGAQVMRLADLPEQLAQFDVLISCTANPVPIVGLGAVERALKARKRRPILMVDLAVPRDVEPEVAALPDVYLYTVDDLSTLVQTASTKRQAAVEQAEAIIETGVQGFVHWLGQRGSVPLIQALQTQTDDWRHAEISRARKLLAKGESLDTVLDILTRGLAQKMLHGTLAELHASHGTQREQLLHTVSRLFLRSSAVEPANTPDTHQS
jgi:glutamyl-tRNA reductase